MTGGTSIVLGSFACTTEMQSAHAIMSAVSARALRRGIDSMRYASEQALRSA